MLSNPVLSMHQIARSLSMQPGLCSGQLKTSQRSAVRRRQARSIACRAASRSRRQERRRRASNRCSGGPVDPVHRWRGPRRWAAYAFEVRLAGARPCLAWSFMVGTWTTKHNPPHWVSWAACLPMAASRLSCEAAGHGARLCRNDASLAAAQLALALEAKVKSLRAEDAVGTVGKWLILPNAVNSVPKEAHLEIDIRDIQLQRRDHVVDFVFGEAEAIAKQREVRPLGQLVGLPDAPMRSGAFAPCSSNVHSADPCPADCKRFRVHRCSMPHHQLLCLPHKCCDACSMRRAAGARAHGGAVAGPSGNVRSKCTRCALAICCGRRGQPARQADGVARIPRCSVHGAPRADRNAVHSVRKGLVSSSRRVCVRGRHRNGRAGASRRPDAAGWSRRGGRVRARRPLTQRQGHVVAQESDIDDKRIA